MTKYLAVTAASLILALSSMDAAFARHHHRTTHHMSHTTGMSSGGASGNNAELGGNNANSGSGPNSLGHIEGGNNGAGK